MDLDSIRPYYHPDRLIGILKHEMSYALETLRESRLSGGEAKLFIGEEGYEVHVPGDLDDIVDPEDVPSILGEELWNKVVVALEEIVPIYVATSPEDPEPEYIVLRAWRSWPKDLQVLEQDLKDPLTVVLNLLDSLTDWYYQKHVTEYEALEDALANLYIATADYIFDEGDFSIVQEALESLRGVSPAHALVLESVISRLPEWKDAKGS